MTELVTYTVEHFLIVKDMTEVKDALREKYNEMFNNVDCFKHVINPYFQKKEYNTKYSQKTYTNKKNNYTKHPRKVISANVDAHIKTCKYILNVINDLNYSKQLSKIIFIIDETNINDIIELIIQTSTLQIFYSSVFIRLIKDIGWVNNVKHRINIFYDMFKEHIYNAFDNKCNDISEYDEFCNIQKTKQKFISMGKLIFLYIINDLCDVHRKDYIEYLCNIIHNNRTNISLIDISLHILLECKKIEKYIVDYIALTEFKDIYNINSKINFLINELYV